MATTTSSLIAFASTSTASLIRSTSVEAIVNNAAAYGGESGSGQLSGAAIAALCTVVAVVAVFGIITSLLFLAAKRRRLSVRQSLVRASRRVTIVLTPKSYGLPRFVSDDAEDEKRTPLPFPVSSEELVSGAASLKTVKTGDQRRKGMMQLKVDTGLVRDMEKSAVNSPVVVEVAEEQQTMKRIWLGRVFGRR